MKKRKIRLMLVTLAAAISMLSDAGRPERKRCRKQIV